MALNLGIVLGDIDTSTSTIDFTDTSMNGATGVAYLLFGQHVPVPVSETTASYLRLSVGASDGTSQWVGAIRSSDAQATTNTQPRGTVADVYALINNTAGGITSGRAQHSAFIANGFRLARAGAPTLAGSALGLVFGGSDASAKAGTIAGNTAISGTASVTGLAWQPNLLFLWNNNTVFDDTAVSGLVCSFGMANDTAQMCFAWSSADAAADSATSGYIDTTHIAHFTAGTDQTHTVTFNSDGFTLTTGGATGVKTFGYLALRLANQQTSIKIQDVPITTGATDPWSVGFEPAVNLAIQTQMSVLDAERTDSNSGAWGISLFNDVVQYAIGLADEDAQATTDTQTILGKFASDLPNDAGFASVKGTWSSQDSTGVTINWSAVNTGGARKFIHLAIEKTSSIASTDVGEGIDYGTAALSTPISVAVTDAGDSQDWGTGSLLTLTATAGADEGGSQDWGTGIVADSFASFDSGDSEDFGTATLTSQFIPATIRQAFPTFRQPQNLIVLATIGGRQIDLTEQVSDYEHELSIFGGYERANIKLANRPSRLKALLEEGIGSDIVVKDGNFETVWEGFVNKIDLRVGGFTSSIGPLLGIVNRAKVTYSTVDIDAGLPIGSRADTAWVDNLNSQEQYGVFERALSSSGLSPTDALLLASLYVEQYGEPESSNDLAFMSSGGDVSLSMECLGKYHLLDTYTYNQTVTEGLGNLSDKLIAVLAELSQTTGFIASNTLQEGVYENDDRTAMTLVKEMVARGDANDGRYMFGFSEGGIPHYEAVSTSVDYVQFMNDPARRVYTTSGEAVAPWHVRPGKIIKTADIAVGYNINGASVASDPRTTLIESVTFRAPYDLSIGGNKQSKLTQKLGRLGVSGVS